MVDLQFQRLDAKRIALRSEIERLESSGSNLRQINECYQQLVLLNLQAIRMVTDSKRPVPPADNIAVLGASF